MIPLESVENISKFVQLDHSDGNSPVIPVQTIEKLVKLVRLAYDAGRVPLISPHCETSRDLSFVKFDQLSGSVPFNAQMEKERTVNDVRPVRFGTGPARSQFPKVTLEMLRLMSHPIPGSELNEILLTGAAQMDLEVLWAVPQLQLLRHLPWGPPVVSQRSYNACRSASDSAWVTGENCNNRNTKNKKTMSTRAFCVCRILLVSTNLFFSCFFFSPNQ